MKENIKLIIALSIFLLISIIILPSIIRGNDTIKDDTSVISPDQEEKIEEILYMFTSDFLNLRSGPGTEYERLTTIQPGEVVQVLEVEADWTKVIYKSQTGYCSSEYLAVELDN